jgi:tetratricopeptide (TPR) repeat protein
VRLAAAAIFVGLTGIGCDFEPAPILARIRPIRSLRPIPRNGPLGRDRKDEAAARMVWGRKHMLAGYDEVGLRSPKWDADARRLIIGSIPWIVGGEGGKTAADRSSIGRELVARGCRDHLVLYLLGRAIFDDTYDSAEPEYFLTQAVEGMKTVPYPRAIARFAASALYGRYEWRNEDIGLRPALRQVELRWFEESLEDASFEPTDSLVLFYQLDNGTGPDFFDRSSFRAAAAIQRATWIEPWVRLRFLGLRHYNDAWLARGGGWAKDVKPDGWKQWAILMAQARDELVESWRLQPDRPQAANTILRLAWQAGDLGEDPRLWFDRAVMAQLDYWPAYRSMLDSLQPRWGGSYREMLAFGQAALDTGRFDTDLPLLAMGAVTRIRKDQGDEEGGAGGVPIYEWPETYPMLVRTFEGYLKEPARPGDKARFEALWAIAADHAHRPAEAMAHLQAAGSLLTIEAAGHLEGERSSEFVARIALAAGDGAADARRADSLRQAFDNPGALEAYRAALAKDPSPQAAPALKRWIAALEVEQRLAGGEWVSVLPTSDALEGWRPVLGTWAREASGALTATAGARGLLLVSDALVGPRFEMRGRLELVTSSNGSFQCGFVFGDVKWGKDNWFSFRVKRNSREGSVAYFARTFEGPAGSAVEMTVPDVNDFLVRVEDGRMTASVNGDIVQREFVPAQVWTKGNKDVRVGLGGYSDENVWTMRFRDLEVRRLLGTGAPRHVDSGGTRSSRQEP